MKQELIEYIKNWQSKEEKPINDPIFINCFIWLMNNFNDDREIEFDGDGSYFGKQITIGTDNFYGKQNPYLSFECCYSGEKICIYTAYHNGFWNPEYLSLNKGDDRFEDVRNSLINRLTKVFGL